MGSIPTVGSVESTTDETGGDCRESGTTIASVVPIGTTAPCARSSIWIERLTTDQKVGGSSPSGRATETLALQGFRRVRTLSRRLGFWVAPWSNPEIQSPCDPRQSPGDIAPSSTQAFPGPQAEPSSALLRVRSGKSHGQFPAEATARRMPSLCVTSGVSQSRPASGVVRRLTCAVVARKRAPQLQ